MQKTLAILLIGCAAYTQAVETSSLRTKLKNLAQIQAQGADSTAAAADDCDIDLEAPQLGDLHGDLLDWCPEEFGAGSAPVLSAGISASALQSVSLNQLQSVSSVPDQMQNTTVQALSNSCNAAAHEEQSTAARIRTFDIHGQICVEENIKFAESSEARERSQGASEKLGVCVVTNEGSDTDDSGVGSLGTLGACSDSGLSYEA